MRISVLLFASAREAVGCSQLWLEVPPAASGGATASTALALLLAAHPSLRALAPCLQLAVNQRHAGAETPLAEGDELALLPPLSGG